MERDVIVPASIGLAVAIAIGGIGYAISNTRTCAEACTYVNKRMVPAHTDHWTEYHCISHNAKTGACTINIPIQRSEYVPDHFYLGLVDCQQEGHEVTVDQSTWVNPPSTWTHNHIRWKQCPLTRADWTTK